MYHDPKSPPGKRRWLSKLFQDEEQPVHQPFAPMPEPPRAAPAMGIPMTIEDREPLLDLTALAEQLADLIAQSKSRLDGAAILVSRSADDAAAYGRALASDAAEIGAAGLPVAMAETLIGLTRAMIERTEACESRLRATNAELRGLQRDLDEAQESAERDPLTGLPNRRGIEYALRCAITAAEATNGALSVAFCDMDAFQRLIDIHGHQVGDRLLRLVGDSLADGAGEGATVGRYGAEEFVLVFDGVSAMEAAARVDAVRATLAARSLRSRSDGTPIGSITFSTGIAGYQQADGPDSILARADAALTRSRLAGGNQVMLDGE